MICLSIQMRNVLCVEKNVLLEFRLNVQVVRAVDFAKIAFGLTPQMVGPKLYAENAKNFNFRKRGKTKMNQSHDTCLWDENGNCINEPIKPKIVIASFKNDTASEYLRSYKVDPCPECKKDIGYPFMILPGPYAKDRCDTCGQRIDPVELSIETVINITGEPQDPLPSWPTSSGECPSTCTWTPNYPVSGVTHNGTGHDGNASHGTIGLPSETYCECGEEITDTWLTHSCSILFNLKKLIKKEKTVPILTDTCPSTCTWTPDLNTLVEVVYVTHKGIGEDGKLSHDFGWRHRQNDQNSPGLINQNNVIGGVMLGAGLTVFLFWIVFAFLTLRSKKRGRDQENE